jgi:hypothetical protein
VGGKKGSNSLVDDGSGMGTKVRACVKGGKKGGNTPVDDGSGKGTMMKGVRERWQHEEATAQGTTQATTQGTTQGTPWSAGELHHLQHGAAKTI